MATIVRLYTHSSLQPAPISSTGGRFSTDAVLQLKQPYLSKQRLTPDTLTAQRTTAALDHAKAKLVFIQVQFGKAVHYEVSAAGGTLVTADNTSPVMSGDTVLEFGLGWSISFLESTE